MQFILYISTLASLLLASTTAAPVTQAISKYKWHITTFQFSRGQFQYDYNFTISAPTSDTSPGFQAQCSGAAQSGFQACEVLFTEPEEISTAILARVKIVQDPKNANDNIPRVVVQEKWRGGNGCEYQLTGGYDKRGFNQPVGSDKGLRFSIVPGHERVVCLTGGWVGY